MIEKLQEQLKKDQALLSSLKVNTISHVLCKTDKGELTLLLRKYSSSYELMLDQVPFSKEEMTFILPNIEHLIK